MSMFEHPRNTIITFAVGAVSALISASFIKSKTAHKIAVCGLAKGLCLKDEVMKQVETIREESKDIYEEARRESDGTEEPGHPAAAKKK